MEAQARLTNSPYPARKMRLMADTIRGMRADKALFTLKVHAKRMYATELEKLIRSAISNWKQANGEGSDETALYVKRINVDGARMLKRVQPAPQGRAHRVRKRFNHITLVLDSAEAVNE